MSDKKTFVNQMRTSPVGDNKIIFVTGQVFQSKKDADNHDPVIKVAKNDKKYFVIHGTYNRKAAAYTFGDSNIPAADAESNVKLYINCLIDENVDAELTKGRVWASDNIQLLGNAVVGKPYADGRMPSLWMTNTQVFNVRSFKNGDKLIKNACSIQAKDRDGSMTTISVLKGTVTKGYDGSPSVMTAETQSQKPYCRFQVKTSLSQHAAASCFAGLEDGSGGASDKYIHCAAFGFTYESVMRRSLSVDDNVTLLGKTNNNEYNGNTSQQMVVNAVLSCKHAETVSEATSAPEAPETQEAPKSKAAVQTPVSSAPFVASSDVDEIEEPDEIDDLPF